MLTRSEGHFFGKRSRQNLNQERQKLFYQVWKPEKPNATLVVTHGICEHSECYHNFAESLGLNHWSIYAWDLPGHGRSEGKRGFVYSFQDYCEDLAEFVRILHEKPEVKAGPVVLFGHSMGGLITVRTILNHPDLAIDGIALSAPALGIAARVPGWKDLASRLLFRCLPEVTMSTEIDYKDLSRDPEVVAGYDKDPLRHDKISPGIYLGMLENMAFVMQKADHIKKPILIQVAGDDRITDSSKTEEFFDRIGSPEKKIIVYKDSLHEIFNDLDRAQAISDLRAYLAALKLKELP